MPGLPRAAGAAYICGGRSRATGDAWVAQSGAAVSAGAAAAGSERIDPSFAEAHARLIADTSIQFRMTPYKPPELPSWLRWLGEFLIEIFPLLRVLFWVAVAGLVLFLLALIAQRFWGIELPWRRRRAAAGEEEETAWRPEEAPARALLREADMLAAEGRYSEAAHLLLFRSIEDIERRRPRLVRPALTSRDIAGAPDLPSGPKSAFGTIVRMVERSLFGGRDLAEPDWRQCRSAYEEFAFAGAWR